MRTGLIQLTSSDDPARNLEVTLDLLDQAADAGAEFIVTPEVTNCVSLSRKRQAEVLTTEDKDPTLAACRDFARARRVWLLLGSLALKRDDDARFANRSFLIDPNGTIAARYDKIHMFDVQIGEGQNYRESKRYAPGTASVLADLPWGTLGITICYDMRFPGLYRALAKAGAELIAVPSSFTVPTGKAHWHTLLRARAIETQCFVLAAAQAGDHECGRQTYGHSIIISPWGEVLAEADGETTGIITATIDLAEVDKARGRIPSLSNDQPFDIVRAEPI